MSRYTFPFPSVYGVDFSGAKSAGRTTWVARVEVPSLSPDPPIGRLTDLYPLARACQSPDRFTALRHLVATILCSERTLWALDFPFGLPVEVVPEGRAWRDQLALLEAWGEDAYGLGLECVRRAVELGGPMHIRRLTDTEMKAPFDPYHYRIIYQTFYGMRDVVGPLSEDRGTAVLPFQYKQIGQSRRVVVEACPSSTLKLLGLPHFNYKQPQGGPLLRKRRRTKRMILDGLARHVRFDARHRRVMMRNGGGDALDAVLAAVGAVRSWLATDHRRVSLHPRYVMEGRLYV